MNKRYYLIRIGEGSKYAHVARAGEYAGIGWGELGDLSGVKTLAAIKKSLKAGSYGYSDQQVATQAGQIKRFLLDMQPGDVVLTPYEHGTYLVGTAGEYYFDPNPNDGCHYHQRRNVDWKDVVLSKEDMSTNLSYSLGATLTIFSLNKYAEELKALIAGEVFTPADKPQRIRELIVDGLLQLDGREFELFLRHLLEVVGFQAEATRYSGDKGIDVMGTLDAEGLADVNLRVQAKRIRSTVKRKDVAALRGDLEESQLGCFITLSSFSKDAVEAAEAPNMKPIKIVDGDSLAAIILRNFDDIDEEYKHRFGIRRKKDYSIEDQFEPVGIDEAEDSEELVADTPSWKPDWDTIVCPAQEDGFKRAFLGQKAWWAIRIRERNLPHIKHIAMYQVAPLSQITHYGEVDRIELYEDTGKYKVFLKGGPVKLTKPIGLGEKPNLRPQSAKYAKLADILKANTIDDIWG